ncbi:hypothetical protein AK812_SmicGene14953 [Symbiodinium microadriaticum]|uniref:Uncharacterized protein n=1 Tax=Symbiodinium microadriaticum TaxID=2951 RepID=A0A1Q9E459_SYMMI|nr:hypothetical protein AK812_SmicGene14953 [Symbiodinium microadriaticum]CAE6945460.1 unnamed protein product [Symbiodinium sp. KB8]CAE7873606.1 unnamed protein product [Symbiodinium microadriaticum]
MEELIAKMTFIADIAFVGVMTWASPFIALPTGQMSPDFGSSRYTVQLIRYDPGQATLASCAAGSTPYTSLGARARQETFKGLTLYSLFAVTDDLCFEKPPAPQECAG